jgi:ABC-type bacteriocin/lantibiotic exporter with double-glycine peptidase domain
MKETSGPLHQGLQSALEFRNVSFGFDGKPVLLDISLRREHGEMILLTGESGSGKSVLL